jgi:hypothetical protein
VNHYDLYRFVSGDVEPSCTSLVRAHSKSGFAASRRTMNVHRVSEMVARRDGATIRFATRWICGGGSVDAVPVADPDSGGARCSRCDERLADLLAGLIAVYRIYDHEGGLLYIGSTTNGVNTRLAGHKKAAWWPLMDPTRTRVDRFDNELQARAAELRAIRAEQPRFNVHGRWSA